MRRQRPTAGPQPAPEPGRRRRSAEPAAARHRDPAPAPARRLVVVAGDRGQRGDVPARRARYRYAGREPGVAFDCSGLTMWAWAQAGVGLPHQSAGQYGQRAPRTVVGRATRRPDLLLQPDQPRRPVSSAAGGSVARAANCSTGVMVGVGRTGERRRRRLGPGEPAQRTLPDRQRRATCARRQGNGTGRPRGGRPSAPVARRVNVAGAAPTARSGAARIGRRPLEPDATPSPRLRARRLVVRGPHRSATCWRPPTTSGPRAPDDLGPTRPTRGAGASALRAVHRRVRRRARRST